MRALRVAREDREEDVGVDALHLGVGGQIHDVVGIVRNRVVVVQAMQHRQAILWAHVATLRALELRALVPRGHDGEDREREQHREPAAVQELGHRRDEEHEHDHGEHDREQHRRESAAHMPQVHGDENRRHDHRDRERQAIGGGDVLGIAEDEQHQQRGAAQHHVHGGNVQLAARTGRIAHLQVGHPVEAGGFGDYCECAGDERLRGDDAGDHRQQHGHVAHAGRQHGEERVGGVPVGYERRILERADDPRALAEV